MLPLNRQIFTVLRTKIVILAKALYCEIKEKFLRFLDLSSEGKEGST